MKLRMFASTFSMILLLLISTVNTYADGVNNPQRTQGLAAPAPRGEHQLVALKGSGTFLCAQISKQGGTNDLTFVILDIDGKNVVNMSIAAAVNWGLTAHNPYGIVVLQQPRGATKTLAIGFNSPLNFSSELKLKVDVQEEGVVQILANVIHGR